jgi:hypothetical protein
VRAVSENENENATALKKTRLRGLRALVGEAVEHGSKAVEVVHKATAARTFYVLEAIPPIATPAKVVHVVHDAWLTGVYGIIRAVNGVVGKTLDVVIEVTEESASADAEAEADADADAEGR